MTSFHLTDEQKKEQYEFQKKKFMEGYEELCASCGMAYLPIIDYTPQGAIPRNVVVFYEPKHGTNDLKS